MCSSSQSNIRCSVSSRAIGWAPSDQFPLSEPSLPLFKQLHGETGTTSRHELVQLVRTG